MSTKLRVGNFSSLVGEDDLKALFSRFGSVETVQIVRDQVTGTSKGLAIVVMSRDEDAATAIGHLNFTQYAGCTIDVGRS